MNTNAELTVNSTVVPCNKARVLIVDDEESIVRLFKMILSTVLRDIKIDEAWNGKQAVDIFREGHHAVVLMDLHMPVMDGAMAFETIQHMCEKNDWEMPSVVFCTGYAPSGSLKEVVANNPSHCLLLKPVTADTLLNAVKERLQ